MKDLDSRQWVHALEYGTRFIKICRMVGLIQHRDNEVAQTATCFLIAPDLILTNHHVVTELIADAPHNWVICFDFFKSPEENNFGFYKLYNLHSDPEKWKICSSTQGPKQSKKDDSLQPSLQELDYAILRIQEPAGLEIVHEDGIPRSRGWIRLRTDPIKLNEAVISFQYPGRLPLVFDDEGMIRNFNKTSSRVYYDVKSDNGSSGSPCFRKSDFSLVAMHTGAYSNKLTTGIPISLINDHIRDTLKEHPEILKEIDREIDPLKVAPHEQLIMDIEEVISRFSRLKYEQIKTGFVQSLPPRIYRGGAITKQGMIAGLMEFGVNSEHPPIVKFLHYLQSIEPSLTEHFFGFLTRLHKDNKLAGWNSENKLDPKKIFEEESHEIVFIVQQKEAQTKNAPTIYSLEMKVYQNGNSLYGFRSPIDIIIREHLQRAIIDLWPHVNHLFAVEIKIGIPVAILSWNINQIKLSDEGLSLSQIGPISYFSLDRRNFPGGLPQLQTRWNQIDQRGCVYSITNRTRVRPLNLDNVLGKPRRHNNQSVHISCLKVGSSSNRGQQTFANVLFRSGVPAMVWSKHNRFPGVFPTSHDFNQNGLRKFPELLRHNLVDKGLNPDVISFLLDQPEFYSEVEGY